MSSHLGPTFGAGEDAFKVAGMAATGELTRSDIRAARRLLPCQNLFYLRALLNHLEGEVAEEAGGQMKRKTRIASTIKIAPRAISIFSSRVSIPTWI